MRRSDDDLTRPTLAGLRDTTSVFIERNETSLGELTDVDGLGAFDAKAHFLGSLTAMALEYEDYDTAEPNPEYDHARSAAIGAALLMYVAEHTPRTELGVEATELAAGYYDHAVAGWGGRSAIDSWIAGLLLGFAS